MCWRKHTLMYTETPLCLNVKTSHSDLYRFGLPIWQKKVSISSITNKLHLRKSHPIHIWNIQLWRSAQNCLKYETLMKSTLSRMHWQIYILNRKDSELCSKDDLIRFGMPFMFLHNSLSDIFFLLIWRFDIMNYLVSSCKRLSQLFCHFFFWFIKWSANNLIGA